MSDPKASTPCMPVGPGTFCWNQLHTPDVAASQAFYGPPFGWDFPQETLGGYPWHQVRNAGTVVGDLQPIDPGASMPSHGLSDVRVGDLDQASARAAALGAIFSLFEGA